MSSTPHSNPRRAPHPALRLAQRAAALVWAAPVTLCALPLLPLALWRGRWRWTSGALEISSPALSWFLQAPWFRALTGGTGFAAATIGHVIVARNRQCLDDCRVHEHVHVRQCERWGPLFPLAYVGAGVYAALRAGNLGAYYWNNPFERAARAAETDVVAVAATQAAPRDATGSPFSAAATASGARHPPPPGRQT